MVNTPQAYLFCSTFSQATGSPFRESILPLVEDIMVLLCLWALHELPNVFCLGSVFQGKMGQGIRENTTSANVS